MVSWRTNIVSVVSVLALVTVAVPALAGEESGTETIMGMDPFSIAFENTGSDPMDVTWDIAVTDGVPVNIVLLDEENHEKFTSYLRYEAYKGHQYNYTNASKRTVRVDEGEYYLVIESAHSSMDSSTVRYVVEWGEDSSGTFWKPWCWPVLILLVLVFGVGILFLLWRIFGSGRAAVAPRPGAAPGPGPEGVAQLSPQPEPPDFPAPHDVVRPTGEGATQLSPQPEPPDSPALHDVVSPTGEGATQLGPQPEPPDSPALHDVVRPTGEGATQLGPQPEPPDNPPGPRKPSDPRNG